MAAGGWRAELQLLRNKVEEERRERERLAALLQGITDLVICPVCYELPSGSVPVCPNGHITCMTCQSNSCPICRAQVGGTHSLVAKQVVSLLDRTPCPHQGCGLQVQRKEYKRHLELCRYRQVQCPGGGCRIPVPYLELMDHVTKECRGTFPTPLAARHRYTELYSLHPSYWNNRRRAVWPTRVFPGQGRTFFLSVARLEGRLVARVAMQGRQEECLHYKLDLALLPEGGQVDRSHSCYRALGRPWALGELDQEVLSSKELEQEVLSSKELGVLSCKEQGLQDYNEQRVQDSKEQGVEVVVSLQGMKEVLSEQGRFYISFRVFSV